MRRLRGLVPKVNNRTGLRTAPWPAELPNFVAPLPNPTLTFDAKAGTLGDLDPQQFHCLNSSVVLFAPHLLWPGLVEIKCPLCESKAMAHGWSTSIRRITGLFGVWYLNGARYKCTNCRGGLGGPGGERASSSDCTAPPPTPPPRPRPARPRTRP